MSDSDGIGLTISEQIMYATVRIESQQGLSLKTGTGFFYRFFHNGKYTVPAIITNAHVVRGLSDIQFRMTKKGQDGRPIDGQFAIANHLNIQNIIVYHPDTDLAIIPLAETLEKLGSNGTQLFYRCLNSSMIPEDQQIAEFDALESIVTVGYPGELWDHVNNLPLFHKGNTSTQISKNFQGRTEFLVDFATWPGASGSPVFIMDQGVHFDARTGITDVGSSRFYFVGIVYGVATQEVTGKVVIQQAPTVFSQTPLIPSSRIPTNLGACIRSSRVREFEQLLIDSGLVPPDARVIV